MISNITLPKFALSLLASILAFPFATCEEKEIVTQDTENHEKPPINASAFLSASQETIKLREQRLLSLDEFLRASQEEGVIILDSRSASAYAASHLAGAIHLNFSDFTDKKLSKVIPNKNTKILIYCNNNFRSETPQVLDTMELVGKFAPMALNIPTFINLVGYGYENVYELGEYLDVEDKRLNWKGLSIQKNESNTTKS